MGSRWEGLVHLFSPSAASPLCQPGPLSFSPTTKATSTGPRLAPRRHSGPSRRTSCPSKLSERATTRHFAPGLSASASRHPTVTWVEPRPLSDRVSPIDDVLADETARVRLAAASFLRYHGEFLAECEDLPLHGSELGPIAERVLTEFDDERDGLLRELAAAYSHLSARATIATDPAFELLVAIEIVESLLAADQLH